MAFSDRAPKGGGRAAIADRAQAQADKLIVQWDLLAQQIPGPRSKKTLSGELCVEFAQCTRRLATINPKRIEAWEDKRQNNISLALNALEKFYGAADVKPSIETHLLMAELSMYSGQHEKAKGFIDAARASKPSHVKCMVLQIENDLDLGGDGKAVMAACAADRQKVAETEAGRAGKSPEETKIEVAKSRRRVAEGFYEHAEFLYSNLKRQDDRGKMTRIRDFLVFLGPKTAANQNDVNLPGNRDGLILAGKYSENLGDFAKAEEQYKYALSVSPNNPSYYAKLAGAQRGLVLQYKEDRDFAKLKPKAHELSETLKKGRQLAPSHDVWREIEKSVLRLS